MDNKTAKDQTVCHYQYLNLLSKIFECSLGFTYNPSVFLTSAGEVSHLSYGVYSLNPPASNPNLFPTICIIMTATRRDGQQNSKRPKQFAIINT